MKNDQLKDKKFKKLEAKLQKRQKNAQDLLWKNHAPSLCWLTENIPTKQLAAGALGGILLLSSPTMGSFPLTQTLTIGEKQLSKFGQGVLLREDLAFEVPPKVRSLTPEEEKRIADTLSSFYNITVTAELDGKRLNRSYGIIGTEQHLYRYPGDQLYLHASDAFEWSQFGRYGIAPGLGAWGYFSSSKSTFSGTEALREKYYIAVQTFLAPGFQENVAAYRDFFKYRKMLVINPLTGQAVVADIADAGPAPWTGKQLGGSPEVMYYLGLSNKGKGPVLYFFIDDPLDKVPLGPLSL